MKLPSFYLTLMESLAEMESFLLSARDHKVLDSADFNPLLKQIEMIRSKIQGVKGSLMGLK